MSDLTKPSRDHLDNLAMLSEDGDGVFRCHMDDWLRLKRDHAAALDVVDVAFMGLAKEDHWGALDRVLDRFKEATE